MIILQKIKSEFASQASRFIPFSAVSPSAVIFLYHTVEAQEQLWTKGHRYITNFQYFKKQIQFIKSQFEICTSTELVEKLKNGRLKKHCAAVHFDDGFSTYFDNAIPYLREQKIPSTVFLITSALKGVVPTRNQLAYCLNGSMRKMLLSQWNQIAKTEVDTTIDFNIMNNSEILSWAKQHISTPMENCVHEIYIETTRKNNIVSPFADDKTASLLGKEPFVEIGSHTVSHNILSKMSKDEQRKEIVEAHKELESLFEKKLHHFAYPHGGVTHFDSISQKIVEEQKYINAYSAYGGSNRNYTQTDLKRITVTNHNINDLKLMILLAMRKSGN